MDSPGRLVRARRDRDRAGCGVKRPADPEAQVEVPVAGVGPGPADRAEVVWIGVPGPAAHDPVRAVALDPRRTIRRAALIIVVIAILDPLKDVAMHVVKTEGVRWKLSHRRRVEPLVGALDL